MRTCQLVALAALLASFHVFADPSPPRTLAALEVRTSRDPASGLWTYRYVLRNTSSAPHVLYSLTLGICPGSALQNVHTPPGWTFYQDGIPENARAVWVAEDLHATHIPVGGALAGFSFQSTHAPAPSYFDVMGYDPLSEESNIGDEYRFIGDTRAPAGACKPYPEEGC